MNTIVDATGSLTNNRVPRFYSNRKQFISSLSQRSDALVMHPDLVLGFLGDQVISKINSID